MVTRDDVQNAFRFMLGREMTDEAVIREFTEQYATVEALREAFANSPEFRAKHAHLYPPAATRHADDIGTPRIDTTAAPTQLRAMLDRLEATWRQLGAEEPWWSVVTAEKFRRAAFDDRTEAEFYGSGQFDVAGLRQAAARCGVDLGRLGTCFELGCGVGRLTLWLARTFGRVIAADVSAPHIALARRAAEQAGAANIDFLHLRDPMQFADLPEFDAFFSIIVLQHNPPPVMRFILESVLRRLRPGGIAYFQIPTNIRGYEFDAERYLASPSDGMEMHALPQKALFEVLAASGCELLEFREDHITGDELLSNRVLARKRG